MSNSLTSQIQNQKIMTTFYSLLLITQSHQNIWNLCNILNDNNLDLQMIAWFYAYALHIQTFPFLFLLYWLVTTKEVLMSQVGYVMYWPQGSF